MVNLDQSIQQKQNNEYLQRLKELTKQLEKEYEKHNVIEEERTEINKSIQSLQTKVKDLKPETKVEDLEEDKQKEIKKKTATLIERIVDVLPQALETIANLTPFSSPFIKLIRGGVQSLVDTYKNIRNYNLDHLLRT